MLRRLLVYALVAIALAGVSAIDADAKTNRVSFRGISVVVPVGWRVSKGSPRIYLYKGSTFIDDNCKGGGSKHAGVRLDVAHADAGTDYEVRPTTFAPTSGSGLTSGATDQPCGSSSQSVNFQQNDDTFIAAYVDFGRTADPSSRREAYRILNSIRDAP